MDKLRNYCQNIDHSPSSEMNKMNSSASMVASSPLMSKLDDFLEIAQDALNELCLEEVVNTPLSQTDRASVVQKFDDLSEFIRANFDRFYEEERLVPQPWTIYPHTFLTIANEYMQLGMIIASRDAAVLRNAKLTDEDESKRDEAKRAEVSDDVVHTVNGIVSQSLTHLVESMNIMLMKCNVDLKALNIDTTRLEIQHGGLLNQFDPGFKNILLFLYQIMCVMDINNGHARFINDLKAIHGRADKLLDEPIYNPNLFTLFKRDAQYLGRFFYDSIYILNLCFKMYTSIEKHKEAALFFSMQNVITGFFYEFGGLRFVIEYGRKTEERPSLLGNLISKAQTAKTLMQTSSHAQASYFHLLQVLRRRDFALEALLLMNTWASTARQESFFHNVGRVSKLHFLTKSATKPHGDPVVGRGLLHAPEEKFETKDTAQSSLKLA